MALLYLNMVQGGHPLQTSDALGAAAVQAGPEALTLGVLMNKAQGELISGMAGQICGIRPA